jgi:hypothetical protein
MSGGQHRDDEANGPSQSGERETERSKHHESNQPSAAAQTHRCAQEKLKLRRNVLDGADFVRDVGNSYPQSVPRFDTKRITSVWPAPQSTCAKSDP